MVSTNVSLGLHFQIQPHFRFAVHSVRAVAGIAAIRKDRADVAVELDRSVVSRCERQEHKPNERNVQPEMHVAASRISFRHCTAKRARGIIPLYPDHEQFDLWDLW